MTPLTQREKQVLSRIAAGKSNKQIAYDLTLTVSTIKAHVHAIMTKLGVGNRTSAAMIFVRDAVPDQPKTSHPETWDQ